MSKRGATLPWSIISRYGDPRIRAFRFENNRGACSSYNYGLARARGRFVASLDSDDLFSPEKLARQHAFLTAHPDVDICGTWLLEIDPDGNRVGKDALIYEPWFNIHVDLNDPASWIWKNRLCHSSSVVRRALHDQVGPFREDLIYTPDWQFWLRALVAGARFAVIEEPLTLYRNHGSNITHKRPMGTVEEYARTCTDPAVNAPPFDGHAGFCKCLLPCKNVSVDRIDKSYVEVKDQSCHIYLQ